MQTWCAFRSAHILLHVNVKNDDVVTETNNMSKAHVTRDSSGPVTLTISVGLQATVIKYYINAS